MTIKTPPSRITQQEPKNRRVIPLSPVMLGDPSADRHMIKYAGSQVAIRGAEVIGNHLVQIPAEPLAKRDAESMLAFT